MSRAESVVLLSVIFVVSACRAAEPCHLGPTAPAVESGYAPVASIDDGELLKAVQHWWVVAESGDASRILESTVVLPSEEAKAFRSQIEKGRAQERIEDARPLGAVITSTTPNRATVQSEVATRVANDCVTSTVYNRWEKQNGKWKFLPGQPGA